MFTSDALARRKASPSAFCSLCCWHLAVNNAISEDKMLRQWLFNLHVHTELAGCPTTQAWTSSGLMWFYFNGWADDLSFSSLSLLMSLTGCLSRSASLIHITSSLLMLTGLCGVFVKSGWYKEALEKLCFSEKVKWRTPRSVIVEVAFAPVSALKRILAFTSKYSTLYSCKCGKLKTGFR